MQDGHDRLQGASGSHRCGDGGETKFGLERVPKPGRQIGDLSKLGPIKHSRGTFGRQK